MLRLFFLFYTFAFFYSCCFRCFVVLFHENEVYARFLWQIFSALKITGMCFMKTKFTHHFCQIFVKDFLFNTREGVFFISLGLRVKNFLFSTRRKIVIFLLFGMYCCGFSRKRSLRKVFVADFQCSENHWNVFHEDEVYAPFLSNIC